MASNIEKPDCLITKNKNSGNCIVYLANAANIHTMRWTEHFLKKGYEIHIISFEMAEISGANIINLPVQTFGTAGFWRTVYKIRRIIREIKPVLLHAHYAGMYGLYGALSGFHPYVLSVWGTDVLVVPKKSFFHKQVIRFNLAKADYICSTSKFMAKEAGLYTNKNMTITPFGIDTNFYKQTDLKSNRDEIIIGTIKGLDFLYGIDILIKAYHIVRSNNPDKKISLMIAGEGEHRASFEKLTVNLGISDTVTFLGRIQQKDVPFYLNRFSIFAALSRSESFGVAVLEASACNLPVVVSDAGGLPEVVENGTTGFIVPSDNVEKAALAIDHLVNNPALRLSMGENGREFVKRKYKWDVNALVMENLYKDIIC